MTDKEIFKLERYNRACEIAIVEQFKMYNSGIWEFDFNWFTEQRKPKIKFIYADEIFNEISLIKQFLYDYQFINVYFEIFKKALINDKLYEDEGVKIICDLISGLLTTFKDKYKNIDVWGYVKKWLDNNKKNKKK